MMGNPQGPGGSFPRWMGLSCFSLIHKAPRMMRSRRRGMVIKGAIDAWEGDRGLITSEMFG